MADAEREVKSQIGKARRRGRRKEFDFVVIHVRVHLGEFMLMAAVTRSFTAKLFMTMAIGQRERTIETRRGG